MESKKARKAERKFRRESEDQNAANWATVDAGTIQATICKITAAGGAIRFGYTLDGGAYALGVYGDGAAPYTEYVRPSEDIERILAELGSVFDDDDPNDEPVTRTASKKLPSTAPGKP